MVAPEPGGRRAQVIAGSVAGGMIGHRSGEHHVQPGRLGAALDFFTPIGVDLTGKVHVEAHGLLSPYVDGPVNGTRSLPGRKWLGWNDDG